MSDVIACSCVVFSGRLDPKRRCARCRGALPVEPSKRGSRPSDGELLDRLHAEFDEWTPIARSELGRAGKLNFGPENGENRWVRLAYDLLAYTQAQLKLRASEAQPAQSPTVGAPEVLPTRDSEHQHLRDAMERLAGVLGYGKWDALIFEMTCKEGESPAQRLVREVEERLAVAREDTERLDKAKDLLAEIRASHRDPEAHEYNECEKPGEQCWWCEQAEWVIKGGPKPQLLTTVPSERPDNHLNKD